MPKALPPIKLSHSQLLWVLEHGRDPSPRTLHDMRYLRQLDIPFGDGKRGEGRGSSVHYGFEDLIECGLAIHCIRHRARPREVAEILLKHRRRWRERYREAWLCQDEDVLNQEWLGWPTAPWHIETIKEMPLAIAEEESGWTFREIDLDALRSNETWGDSVAQHHNGTTAIGVRLGRLVIQLVYWANQAPVKRRGRPPRAAADPLTPKEAHHAESSKGKPRKT